MMISRRRLGRLSLSATLAGSSAALAQGKPAKLTIMSHAVHRAVATGAKAGDSTAAWRQSTGVDVEWITFSVEGVHERVYREASLSEGAADIAFLLERYGGPHIAPLFEDLGEWHKRDPIEDLDEIGAGMRGAHTYAGRMIGIPYRHATHGFFYNRTFLREAGLAAAPTTLEEILAAAEKLTYVRGDGTRVNGYALSMDDPSAVVDLVRAQGGDFITGDYRIVCDQEPAVKTATLLREWYRKGVLARNSMTFKTEEVITAMQQGRAAMTNQPFGRFVNYNDPKQSKFPGEIAVATFPMAGSATPAPAKTSVWAMAIPKNARNKELSWSLIKELSSKKSTIRAAANGNGPVRPSAYDDPQVRELAPYSDYERAVLSRARLTVPGFEHAAKAMDIYMEELQKAMLGQLEPLKAMQSAKARIEPLLPKT
ncbi:MAG: extracellular solute-binding protein [Alphaproteobacteria bacterium]|nr:extracellular solute-binding protein [Alphaproteobacteria bacterium]